MGCLMNVLWLLFGGILTAIEYVVASLLLMVTIVGIPFGIQTLKMASLALWPFGKEVRSGSRSDGCLYILMNVVWILLGQFLLGFKWPIFPIWGYESVYYLVLPVIIGVAGTLGADVRFYRAAILDEVYRPYVRTAVAKGVTPTRVLFVHVLRNSLIPIVTYISLSIPYLFTGSLLLESFFGIPGLGSVSINAINSADMSVVRAVVVFGALIYQGVNLLTDIAYGWLDPRVRFAS